MPIVVIILISLIASDSLAQPSAQAATVPTAEPRQVGPPPPVELAKAKKEYLRRVKAALLKRRAMEAEAAKAVKSAEKTVIQFKRVTESVEHIQEVLKASNESVKLLYRPVKGEP